MRNCQTLTRENVSYHRKTTNSPSSKFTTSNNLSTNSIPEPLKFINIKEFSRRPRACLAAAGLLVGAVARNARAVEELVRIVAVLLAVLPHRSVVAAWRQAPFHRRLPKLRLGLCTSRAARARVVARVSAHATCKAPRPSTDHMSEDHIGRTPCRPQIVGTSCTSSTSPSRAAARWPNAGHFCQATPAALR